MFSCYVTCRILLYVFSMFVTEVYLSIGRAGYPAEGLISSQSAGQLHKCYSGSQRTWRGRKCWCIQKTNAQGHKVLFSQHYIFTVTKTSATMLYWKTFLSSTDMFSVVSEYGHTDGSVSAMSAEHLWCDSLSASHLDSRNSRCRPVLPDRSHVLLLCELLQTHPHNTVMFNPAFVFPCLSCKQAA